VLALLLAPALVATIAPPSRAQCNYPFLTSGSAVYYPPGTVYYPTISQNTNYWSAVAVRPDAGSDWDLYLHISAVAYPDCVGGAVANSLYSGSAVDLVIGDFNHNPQGFYYARPYVYSGPGGATVEWDDGSDQLIVNGPWITRPTGPNDVIECWDVFLEQGRRYYFYLVNRGNANLKMLFYQNPGTTYWAGRSAATYVAEATPNSSVSVSWGSNVSDWLGIVVLNEDGLASDYYVAVTTCFSPTLLASGTPVTASSPEGHYSFHQVDTNFAAIGVRPTNLADDWQIHTFAGPFDADYGTCFQNELALSWNSSTKTEYVVGDFNTGANPINTIHYARVVPQNFTAGTAQVEWDDGSGTLIVDDPFITGMTDASDVLASWDVALIAGQTYRFHFEHTGSADLKLGLFRNLNGQYWVPRNAAAAEQGSTFYYTATTTDEHGIVVVNDNGGTGSYELGVSLDVSGVEDKLPLVTRLEGLAPNPVTREGHIRYSLREAGEVSFDIMDVAGRRVSRITDGTRAPGLWNTAWSGAGEDGRRLPSGIYFLRMQVNGRVVEGARFVLLQ
jgi:hypothetical protein